MNNFKKIITAVVAVSVVCSSLSFSAFADTDNTGDNPVTDVGGGNPGGGNSGSGSGSGGTGGAPITGSGSGNSGTGSVGGGGGGVSRPDTPLIPAEHAKHTDIEYTDNEDGTHKEKCNVDGCTYSRDSVSCTYDKEVAEEKYQHTVASCAKAVYYKSCICGAFDPEESATFEYGEPVSEHTGGTPSCSEQAICSVCGQHYGDKLPHTEGTPATCSEQATCSVCGESYGDKLPHTEGTPATCSAKAVCSVCKESYGDVLKHTGGAATTEKKATCELCSQEYGKLLNVITLNIPDDIVYGSEDGWKITASAKEGAAVTLTYSDKEDGEFTAKKPENAGKYYVKAASAETDTYEVTETTAEFEIKKAKVTISTNPSADSIKRGSYLSDSELSGGRAVDADRKTVKGKFEWEKPDTQMSTSGSQKANVVFTPDDGNYETVTFKVNIKIEKPTTSTGSSSGGFFGSVNSNANKILIKFDSNGGSLVQNQQILTNTAVRAPMPPYKAGYTFVGWYSDAALTTPFDLTTKLNAATTLYAKWLASDTISLTIGDVKAAVFGQEVVNDVAPIIRSDRTMLPARFVAEALGAKVDWNPETRVVTIVTDNINMVITIGSELAQRNGVDEALDSPAFIENDRTYLPLRYICEGLGATVEWDDSTKTASIRK